MTVEIRTLLPSDVRSAFQSGDDSLDQFFRRYAGQNQFRHHVGVSYVAVEGDRILGFVTVSAGSMDAEHLPSGRQMPPYPVPTLAVDRGARARGVGRALLRFSVELAERMQEEFGCVGLVVDAKKDAVEFYRRYGFVVVDVIEGSSESRPRPTEMFLPLGSVPPRR